MPRRNLYALLIIAIVSLVCYQQADSAHRSRYGRMFDAFVEVLEEVDKHYVEQVDDRELFEGALHGLVAQLDPYSSYLGPAEATESRQSLDGEFGGIGIEVSIDRETKVLTVLSPIVGTPAYEAGVQAGDKILQINGESTEGFTLEDTIRRLRGRPGTSVQLSVLHEGDKEPVDITVQRAIIHVDSVVGFRRQADGSWDYWLPGKPRIGYLRITTFGKKTGDEFRKLLADLTTSGMQALVIDLRNNSGGLLNIAVDIADLFVSSGRIVSTVGRDHAELERFDASGHGPYTQLPLVVLVNQYSASASEIVAACLQDHGRAMIVGQRTFGKGTVQSAIAHRTEGGKSVLRLTIATYWRPSGRNIHRGRRAKPSDAWGVLPNPGFDVPLTDQQLAEVLRRQRQRDVVRRAPATGQASTEDLGRSATCQGP